MPERTIYFDESGFTGWNLLDGQQPYFAVASTVITPEDAAEILSESFPKYQGQEFKFSNIWRSRRNRHRLPEFVRRIGSSTGQAFVWWVDKKFAVLCKIIDFLVEPIMTNAGYDFYGDGFSLKFSNYIHFGLTHVAKDDLYNDILHTYQRFSRDPHEESLGTLQNEIRDLLSKTGEPMRSLLEPVSTGADLFKLHSDLGTFGSTDDIQVTCIMRSVAHWRNIYSEDFRIVHDDSSNFFRRRYLWERLVSRDVPDQLLPTSDGTDIQFPLRVLSTISADSKKNDAVQLCDILAGLTVRCLEFRDGEGCQLLEAVIDAGFGAVPCGAIRPGTDFPDFPPKPLVGSDVIDGVTEIIFGRHHNMRDDHEN